MRRVRFPLLSAPLRWLGVALVAAALVYFSLLVPAPAPPEPGPLWDKKLHFAGYLAFGLALAYATAGSRDDRRRRAAIVLGLAVLFGVVVEVLQGPLPNRYFSYGDVLANALGALLAAGWFLVEPRLSYVRFPE